jgi:cytoskeletal protein RodZ
VIPDDRLRDLLQEAESRTPPNPAFIGELYSRLEQQRRRRRSRFVRWPWLTRGAVTSFAGVAVAVGVIAVTLVLQAPGSLDGRAGASGSQRAPSASAGGSSSPPPTLSASAAASLALILEPVSTVNYTISAPAAWTKLRPGAAKLAEALFALRRQNSYGVNAVANELETFDHTTGSDLVLIEPQSTGGDGTLSVRTLRAG